MPWRANSLSACWPTSAFPSPAPTVGRAEQSLISDFTSKRSDTFGEYFKCRNTEVRGRDSHGTCPPEPHQDQFSTPPTAKFWRVCKTLPIDNHLKTRGYS